jgi:energy-coupling factor transporter ATP-binding protein EcfA2
MTIQFKNTSTMAAQHIKVLVHGPSGSGKTRLCATTGGKPLIISAEAGLLSLRGTNIDVFEIKNVDNMREIYNHLLTDTVFDWVCLDSISEVAETVLASELKINKDPRKAYGELSATMSEMIRAFRDLPKNVYMSSKQDRVKDDVTGQVFFGPSAPGQKLGVSLPYFFDEVFALHNWKDENGVIQSALQTQRDDRFEAKDRSGALALAEPADLSKIYAKIMNKQTKVA